MDTPDPRIEAIVTRHEDFVRGWARHLAPAAGLDDDIVQQVFTEFVAKAAQWDLDADLKPLLFGMTRNVARRAWRERLRAMTPEMRDLAEHIRTLNEETEAPAWSEAEVAALRACLAELPPRSRRIVDLHYDRGVSTVTLADQLAMRADAIRRALFRIRRSLRTCIERRLGGVACD